MPDFDTALMLSVKSLPHDPQADPDSSGARHYLSDSEDDEQRPMPMSGHSTSVSLSMTSCVALACLSSISLLLVLLVMGTVIAGAATGRYPSPSDQLYSMLSVTSPPSPTSGIAPSSAFLPGLSPGRTLVIVVHFGRPAYTENLHYFVEKAVRCWQDADYRIIVQTANASTYDRRDREVRNGSWTAGLPPSTLAMCCTKTSAWTGAAPDGCSAGHLRTRRQWTHPATATSSS